MNKRCCSASNSRRICRSFSSISHFFCCSCNSILLNSNSSFFSWTFSSCFYSSNSNTDSFEVRLVFLLLAVDTDSSHSSSSSSPNDEDVCFCRIFTSGDYKHQLIDMVYTEHTWSGFHCSFSRICTPLPIFFFLFCFNGFFSPTWPPLLLHNQHWKRRCPPVVAAVVNNLLPFRTLKIKHSTWTHAEPHQIHSTL